MSHFAIALTRPAFPPSRPFRSARRPALFHSVRGPRSDSGSTWSDQSNPYRISLVIKPDSDLPTRSFLIRQGSNFLRNRPHHDFSGVSPSLTCGASVGSAPLLVYKSIEMFEERFPDGFGLDQQFVSGRDIVYCLSLYE